MLTSDSYKISSFEDCDYDLISEKPIKTRLFFVNRDTTSFTFKGLIAAELDKT